MPLARSHTPAGPELPHDQYTQCCAAACNSPGVHGAPVATV
ncbi:hypothetical protein [Streptomyces sp. NPDC002573]